MILVPGFPLNMDNIKGGVHSAVSNLLKGFSNCDIKVRIVSFSREVTSEVRIPINENIEVLYSPEGPYPYHSMNYLIKGPGILKKHIREFNPDLIHFEEGSSFMFTKLFGISKKKTLLTIHGMSFAEAKRKKKLIDKITWYYNGFLQMKTLPRNVIHLSNFSANLFKSKNIPHAEIIPNAIVPQYFNLQQKASTDNLLLYMGVIDNNKNLLFLLSAMKVMVDKNKIFTLDVLGDYIGDIYKNVIETYIAENNLGAYVRFNGWVPQTSVLTYIEKTDIVVVSSKHESLPMVIAEAMAAGKVVAASAVGGIPEMIEHGENGYLFNLPNTNELVQILEDLYDNNTKINAISREAKATAERYRSDCVAKKTIEFYKKCI
jgi:glycosyltransferase involved in cell wall biosynthesis